MRPKLVPELFCSDLDQSLRFYRDLLGFQILYDRPESRFAFLHRDGAEMMLCQPHTQDRLWPKAELEKPYGRGVNLEIQVTDVDKLHAAVVSADKIAFCHLRRGGIGAKLTKWECANLRCRIQTGISFVSRKTSAPVRCVRPPVDARDPDLDGDDQRGTTNGFAWTS